MRFGSAPELVGRRYVLPSDEKKDGHGSAVPLLGET